MIYSTYVCCRKQSHTRTHTHAPAQLVKIWWTDYTYLVSVYFMKVQLWIEGLRLNGRRDYVTVTQCHLKTFWMGWMANVVGVMHSNIFTHSVVNVLSWQPENDAVTQVSWCVVDFRIQIPSKHWQLTCQLCIESFWFASDYIRDNTSMCVCVYVWKNRCISTIYRRWECQMHSIEFKCGGIKM